MRKPPAVPIPRTGGGVMTRTRPSWIGDSFCRRAARIAGPDFRGSLRPLCERFERDEDGTRVGSVGEGGAGEADQVDRVVNPGHLKGYFRDTPIDFIGSCQRSAPRQLCYDDEVALIDLRDEANRRFSELVETEQDHAEIHKHHQRGEAHDPRRQPTVATPERVETKIEGAKVSMDRAWSR